MADAGRLYDENYFAHHLGEPYRPDHPGWQATFDRIAEKIAAELAPRSVLDAGCGVGFLVRALRRRGIEAYGLDISEYAIRQVPAEIAASCWVGSVTDALPRDYDLIVCIEVLEHLSPTEAEDAVENLAAHTDSLLFSSTPTDYREPTHLNVQPPEYWIGLFARSNLFRNVDLDASFVAPHAVHLRRRDATPVTIARDYERWHWRHAYEIAELRSALLAAEAELARQRTESRGASTARRVARAARRALANGARRASRPLRSSQ
jgi:SAM-dependent methyltransferase